ARRSMEFGAAYRHHFGDLRRVSGGELQFNLFGMSLIVRTRVEVSDHQRLVRLSQDHRRHREMRTDRDAEMSDDCSSRERAHKYQDSPHHLGSLLARSIAVVRAEASPTITR